MFFSERHGASAPPKIGNKALAKPKEPFGCKLVVHHSDFDVLIPSHSRIGKLSGGTRISMLLGTPG